MNTPVRPLNLVLALLLGLSAAAPAAAVTIGLTPLHLQSPRPANLALLSTCRTPNVDAAVNGTPFFEMPAIAAGQGATGVSGVAIQLSSTGALVSESILESSGNPNLDRAALLSARLSRFTPEVSNCRAVGGTYLYSVTF